MISSGPVELSQITMISWGQGGRKEESSQLEILLSGKCNGPPGA